MDFGLWTEAGDGYRVVPIPYPCARLITNMTHQTPAITLYRSGILQVYLDGREATERKHGQTCACTGTTSNQYQLLPTAG